MCNGWLGWLAGAQIRRVQLISMSISILYILIYSILPTQMNLLPSLEFVLAAVGTSWGKKHLGLLQEVWDGNQNLRTPLFA